MLTRGAFLLALLLLVCSGCGDDDDVPIVGDGDETGPVGAAGADGPAGVVTAPRGTEGSRFDAETRAFMAKRPSYSIILAGAWFGRHKPCGCSAPQLGGLKRTGAFVDRAEARARGPVTPLALGWAMKGSGEEQEEAKAGFIRAALQEIGFQGFLLGETDLEVPAAVQPYGGEGMNQPTPPYNVVLPQSSPAREVPKKLNARVGELEVRALSLVDPAEGEELKALGYAQEVLDVTAPFAMLKPEPEALWIVATRLTDRAAFDALSAAVRRIGPAVIVDFGGAVGTSTAGPVRLAPDMEPLVVAIAEKGKELGVLDFHVEDGVTTMEFRAVPLVPELEDDDSPRLAEVRSLLKDYIAAVREEDYLSRFQTLPDMGAKFVGSSACAKCHEAIYQDWYATSHAHAMETLRGASYDADPECVRCHVVGWLRMDNDSWARFDSGYLNDEKSRHLGGVGCENCHGAGSKHVEAPEQNRLFSAEGDSAKWRSRCVKCHDADNSHGFVQDWKSYLEKVGHRAVPSDRRTIWK